jgi:putative protease
VKSIFYYTDDLDLSLFKKNTEFIVEHVELSRFGKLTTKEVNHAAARLKEHGFKISLEWDILMSETVFNQKVHTLEQIDLILFDSIRAQDPGAIEYVVDKLECHISLILETGNHNLIGIQNWIDHCQGRVDRVILSVELDKKTLSHYSQSLDLPIEFLALGRILIFYTPRNLLSALLPEDDEKKKVSLISNEFLTATGESEESPHRGFPLVENSHGTFMFHIKRLNLLDSLKDLDECGISVVRVDTRFEEDKNIDLILKTLETSDATEFKAAYGFDSIRGYFNINKTDVLFKKLKNSRLQRKDESYVGEVLETNKGNYMAIMIRKTSLKIGDELKFITPEGKTMECKVYELKNSRGEEISESVKGELCLMNYFGSVWPKSQVYLR